MELPANSRARENPGLILWTIYDHPKDFPNTFVARAWNMDQPTDQLIIAPSLEELREIMVSWGLSCLTRNPEDDPCIVETWI